MSSAHCLRRRFFVALEGSSSAEPAGGRWRLEDVAARGGEETTRILPRLREDDLAEVEVRGSDLEDPTGGMAGKLGVAIRLARQGVPSQVLNGNVPGRLARALAGDPGAGTVVEAAPPPTSEAG